VSIAIIGILSTIVIVDFRTAERRSNLNGASDSLAQMMRRAQAMALSGQKVSGATPGGYGVYLQNTVGNNGIYRLYADTDKNNAYTGVSEITSNGTTNLPSGVTLQSFVPVSASLDVLFTIPVGTIYINGVQGSTDAQITVSHTALNAQKILIISPLSGSIRVQ